MVNLLVIIQVIGIHDTVFFEPEYNPPIAADIHTPEPFHNQNFTAHG